MFGESNIYGQWRNSVDNKSRIKIPGDTGVTIGEKLVLLKKDSFFAITSLELIDEYVEMIYKIVHKNPKCIDIEAQKNLDSLYEKILTCSSVDNQRRFNSCGYLSSGEYRIIGAKKCIYIKKEEEARML